MCYGSGQPGIGDCWNTDRDGKYYSIVSPHKIVRSKYAETTETEAIKSELNEKWIKVRGLKRQNTNVLTNNIRNTAVTKKQLIGSILVSSTKKKQSPAIKFAFLYRNLFFGE